MGDNFPPAKEVAKNILLTGAVVGGVTGIAYLANRIIARVTADAPAKPPPATIDLTFAETVRKDLTTQLNLDPTAANEQGKENRHRIYFLYRRAIELGLIIPDLRTPQRLEDLKQQVKAEFEQVNQFLDEKLGTTNRGPYFGGPEILMDLRHLDLGKFVSPNLFDPPATTERDAVAATTPTTAQVQTLQELDRRKMRVKGIVWRAAALYPDVWGDIRFDSKLLKLELSEILDRRLRTVERLHYEASAGATPAGIGASFLNRDKEIIGDNNSSDVDGWSVGLRYRMFEAPSVPRLTSLRNEIAFPDPSNPTTTQKFHTLEGAFRTFKLGVDDAGSPRFKSTSSSPNFWYLNHLTDEFDWNVWPGTRLKEPMINILPDPDDPKKTKPSPKEWKRVEDTGGARGYGWIMNPRRLATAAIKELFVIAVQDLWDKSWLHSDGVLSALHIEALFFGLHRRKALQINEEKSEDDRKKIEEELLKLDAEERELEQRLQKFISEGQSEIAINSVRLRLSEIATKKREFLPKEQDVDKAFNALPDVPPDFPGPFDLALDDYFEVRRGINRAPKGIMRPPRNDHFENSAVPFNDLQIGDQVLFETSPVLQALGATLGDYPTVLVTEIDSLPPGPNVNPAQLTVQGFNSPELTQPSFQLLLAKSVDAALNGLREHIRTQLAKSKAQAQSAGRPFEAPEQFSWDPGILNQTDLLRNDTSLLRFWNPYSDQWDEPGPWWVWINLQAPILGGAFAGPVEKTLAQTPGGVVWLGDKLLIQIRGRKDPLTIPTGSGFQEPPWKDIPDEEPATAAPGKTIFVPLFEPKGGWSSYFTDKAKNSKAKRPTKLTPVKVDTSWLPGLAKTGDKIRVIRPQLEEVIVGKLL
jgi:hypothetical protein